MIEDRRHQATLHPEERRFRRLAESFAQAIWEADAAGMVVEQTSIWPQFTGQTSVEWLGRGWLDAVHPGDRDEVEFAWDRALETAAVYDQDYRFRSSTSSDWIWTHAHAAPVLGDDGRVSKWVGMNVDITARKTAEQALRTADLQKDLFISILAHELRNPLAPIRSGIDLLLNDSATATARAKAIAAMSRQVDHLARLVDDLADASRITTGKLQVHRQPVRLAAIVKAAVENIEPAINAKRQHLSVIGLGEVDPALDADPVRMTQALVNILNNSTKFSAEGTLIQIRAGMSADRATVVVKDQGCSIPECDQAGLFKLFVQSARHDPGDGLGIGLALANDIVRLHGGTLEARTPADGIGAEFEIRLPMAANQERAIDREPPPTADPWQGSRILVVDDNREAAEILGALLEMEGHTIRIVHDGQRAVGEAEQFSPDIIFMDIGMPIMDGLEATRRIRRLDLPRRPFIVALTGWNSEASRDAGAAAGCDLHLAKPADLETVTRAIDAGRQSRVAPPA